MAEFYREGWRIITSGTGHTKGMVPHCVSYKLYLLTFLNCSNNQEPATWDFRQWRTEHIAYTFHLTFFSPYLPIFSCPMLPGTLQIQNIKQLQSRIQFVLPLWVWLPHLLSGREGGDAGSGNDCRAAGLHFWCLMQCLDRWTFPLNLASSIVNEIVWEALDAR